MIIASVESALSNAISALGEAVDHHRLTFDITESDAQGCVLGLHFAIADVLTYARDIADDSTDDVSAEGDSADEALTRWQFHPGASRWTPRDDFCEGEYADDYEQCEREELYALSVADLIALGNLCEIAQCAVVAAGRDY